MRLGGLGQLWQTLRRLVSIMLVCQLLSPVVAFMAILLMGTESVVSSEATELTPEPSKLEEVTTTSTTTTSLETVSGPDSCCDTPSSGLCPSDQRAAPHLCQDPAQLCSALPLSCVSCSCDYNCHYGKSSTANCTVLDTVLCQGERNFTRHSMLEIDDNLITMSRSRIRFSWI